MIWNVKRSLRAISKNIARSLSTTNVLSQKYVNLSDSRKIIVVKGDDRLALLQNLITNDIQNLEVLKVLYAFMLNSKGRTMFDVILYDIGNEEIAIECDATLYPKVFKHLSMYKIRKKIQLIKNPDNLVVGHLFPDDDESNEKELFDYNKNGENLLFWDPRLLPFGKRSLLPLENYQTEDLEYYRMKRYQVGIAEGSEEVEFGKALPLQYNLDHMSGVSFHKGCYLGQELTARTFNTGVTRKRIVPAQLPPGTTDVDLKNEKGKKVGKVLCSNSQGGSLVMLKVENIDRKLTIGEHAVFISQPEWWRRKDPDTVSFGLCDDFRHADYRDFSSNY